MPRLDFSLWSDGMLRENEVFSKYVIIGDESSFTSIGLPNHQNHRQWSPENPHWTREIPMQTRWKVNVWTGIVNDEIIGPHFFEGNLNAQMYAEFLENHLDGLLHHLPQNVRDRLWWQQDGAPAHTASVVREILNQRFTGRWIGLHGPVVFPPRSPDLTPLDFFLWGTIRNKVYLTPPTTQEDMQERIVAACRATTRQTLEKVRANLRRRIDPCIEREGGHFEELVKGWQD